MPPRMAIFRGASCNYSHRYTYIADIMSQQLRSEVERRQGKANKSTIPRTALFSKEKRRAALGGIRTHDALLSRQAFFDT